MAHEIGFVDNTGSEGVAHWQMLLKIKTLAEANGWVTQRYLNPTPYTDKTVIRELILKGAGLSGTEEIYIGFRAYQDQTSDYYNLTVAAFTGYVAGNIFTAQPGFIEYSMCAHNQRVDYWLAVNGQRILFCLKIGAVAVYEIGYAGKFFPYATPAQYPYPMCVCGTLPGGLPARRYSDLGWDHSSGVRGLSFSSSGNDAYGSPNASLRTPLGTWTQFCCIPWDIYPSTVGALRRDTGGYLQRLPCEMFTTALTPFFSAAGSNVWGALDGVAYISGFNNVSENTASINGNSNVVFGNVWRVGIGDYFMLEMN